MRVNDVWSPIAQEPRQHPERLGVVHRIDSAFQRLTQILNLVGDALIGVSNAWRMRGRQERAGTIFGRGESVFRAP